ncbi:hypothetical protein VIBHAR_05541 [Vibrio campbellii ATCC BAA-1116]|uniref:Uncharacterized protein n=1 Tax=Vibrio campbellii (strain ATCC BAA-1116) TaxID=2902295 RepID=A7N4A2_VIBC1|nr:hypothetical protein VIBHAR_05541 [Vibrio campbellii ATCC BAA-1116]
MAIISHYATDSISLEYSLFSQAVSGRLVIWRMVYRRCYAYSFGIALLNLWHRVIGRC